MMESSCEDDYFYDSEEDYDSEMDDEELAASRNIFGNKGASKVKIYCAICAGKHSEDKCPNKTYSRSY